MRLQVVRVAELVHQPLRPLRLLHDALLVVLPYRPAELVVVHRGPVLPLTPEPGHLHRVLDLEDALRAIQPPDARAVHLGGREQLLQELPEVDVGAAGRPRRRGFRGVDRGRLFFFVCKWGSHVSKHSTPPIFDDVKTLPRARLDESARQDARSRLKDAWSPHSHRWLIKAKYNVPRTVFAVLARFYLGDSVRSRF